MENENVDVDYQRNDEKVVEEKKSVFDHVKNPKIWILALLGGLLIYIVIDAFTTNNVKSVLTDFLDYIEEIGFWGGVLFAMVYVVATVALIPGSVLTLGAGFVFTRTNGGSQVKGTLIATTVVFLGASIGACLAFLLGRYLLRDFAQGLTKKYKVFRAIDKAIEGNGGKIVLLLRLSPAIPFNILNYLLGTTAVSFKEYALACIGLLPGTTAFCFIGSTLNSLSDTTGGAEKTSGAKTVEIIVLIVGIIASILAVVAVTIFARRELKKHLVEEETSQQLEEGTP